MVTQNQALVASAIGFIAVAVVIVTLLVYSVSISGFGTIRTINVNVYGDENCTKQLTSVDWGAISPGGTSAVTFWIKSTSTGPINLTLTTSNWTPSTAQNFMTCTWTYSGINLAPGAVAVTDVTLRVAQNISNVTNFSFTMIVTGT
jgi:hypothetical protein